MKYPESFRFFPGIALLCLAIALFETNALAQSIRLRNETITPPDIQSAAAPAASAPAEPPASGLFLIQFNGKVSEITRAQLRAAGVELLRYVPDNAFVAKVEGARIGQLRQMPSVRWIGNYRPEHKIHGGLLATPNAIPAEPEDVAVLLSPAATDAEAAQVKNLLSVAGAESRNEFGRVVRGKISPGQLNTLAQSDAVLWIEPARPMKLFDEVSSRLVGGEGPPGQTLVQSLGYDGSGVTIAVADSGLDSGDTNSMHPDLAGRVSALFYYGTPGQLEDAADEHSHGTHVAGIIAGNGATGETDENGFLYGLGVAPGSMIIGQRLFDAAGGYAPPPNFETMTRDAKLAGADIASNSWGDDTQGRYDISAMQFDALVRDADPLTLGDQQYIIEFSAGNAGPAYQTIGSPAVAKNVIATGANNSDRINLPIEEFTIYDTGPETMADFSSRGPCEDGRIKPDVVAPGTWIASLRSIYANDDYAWWPISGNYMYQGGTSQAGPHVSGAAAVFVQFYRATHGGQTPSPALVKAALINSARDLDNFVETDPVPNNDEGWGQVDLPALIASSRSYDFVDQSALLTDGAVYEKRILVSSSEEPLKVTLTYTDVPGNPAAVIALVNDLDLEVISPDGNIFLGNRFDFGESIPNASGPDNLNNVEAVHLFEPVPGEYLIRVRGTRIVEDSRRDTPQIDQDFALVTSAAIGAPGVGIVTFHRQVYSAPDQIHLTLVDYDLAGQPGVNLTLRSTTEPAGEVISLNASGTSGIFTGAVASVSGPAAPNDGQLQIAHDDLIEALYADASPASNRVFAVIADLLPPVISNVRGTNQFGQVLVTFETDEPARSTIFYGTNAPNLGLTNQNFDTEHLFGIGNLPVDAVIRFLAVAQDEAGNRATNDNAGAFFTVTNLLAPTVLLIDSYADNGFIEVPPISGYTDALNALGMNFSFFDARSGAEPTIEQLQAHRCVIWRMDEIVAPPPTLGQKIATYINNGGSLLIASMEGVTRLAEAGLTTFSSSVLQIQSYIEDQPVMEIAGAPGDPVGMNIDTPLDYSPYQDLLAFLELIGVPDPSDWITPTTNATPILLADGSIVGVRAPKTGVDLPGRVVYLSFPLDAVPLGSGIGNNRAGLLQNILNFLAPQVGSSSLTLDSDVYSVPGRAVIEVEDPDLRGQIQTTVNVTSPQHTNEISVTLNETVRQGLFRGSILFVPTNTGAPGTFTVQSDDTVEVHYFDASAGQTLNASATIETNAPAISNIFIEPGYLEAIVTWETSEDADSLVQYSEIPGDFPVNHVAYDPARDTFHELLLTGLKPNTKYYIRVVSRDRAGNVAIDDNNGQFYTFETLQPRLPPWFDDMETNSIEWSVISAAESESQWTRGAPGGGESAHSGSNVWGSNLDGGPVSVMESYLISPGLFLGGGNKATLRFWHNYDFTAVGDFDFQLAAIEIITNVTSEPLILAQMPEDFSLGWEYAEFDLTPYMNNVVYIVWYHFLFSLDAPPRLGWLVDDVSITVETATAGTVQITNNLWQAVFALTGPVGSTGRGRWNVISNAPAGQYVVQFGDVPHYITPPPQTNILSTGGQITFSGNYTFTDANANGIPDSWELENFLTLDPQRTMFTDTDGDGMSDWAEAMADTDPNNPPPAFRVRATKLPDNSVQLSWRSVTNHTYRVHASAELSNWTAYSDSLPATGTNTTFVLPNPTNGAPGFFRVEAVGPGTIPNLRTTARVLTNGIIQLEWPARVGRGYRVLESSNIVDWSPVTDWLRATNSPLRVNFSSTTNSPNRWFRVEVQP